jgi:hypothetical protein
MRDTNTDKARAEAHAAAMAEQANIEHEIDCNDAIPDARKPFVEAQRTSAESSTSRAGSIGPQGGVTASPIRSSGGKAWDPPPATPPGRQPQ